jgi:dipeptidyl aminopeptidase/acylaminoacyl peptidase
MPYFCNWRELGASAGYLTLSPNYRGSQGRGHTFASAASAGVGIYDWPDCDSMVDEAVKRGWADPDRLGVAGWSHGKHAFPLYVLAGF